MHTLESLRGKIDTATDLQSVVKTMKTLAAVSIRQYERAVDALNDYNHAVELGFQISLRDIELAEQAFTVEQQIQNPQTGAIVFGSDQGMCGQFNEHIAGVLRDSQVDAKVPWKLLAVGNRVEGHLRESKLTLDGTFRVPTSVSEITDLVQDLLLQVERWQDESDISRLFVFYNSRKTGATYRANQSQVLPIGSERFREWRQRPWESRSLPMFTMDRPALLSCVVRQYIFVSLFQACAESLASENASRIAAMQVAEKSIEQRLDDLRNAFNQRRQSAITEELLDVVSGFEALSKRPDK